MSTEYTTPNDVLERQYREILTFADARGISFNTAVKEMVWSAVERDEIEKYRKGILEDWS